MVVLGPYLCQIRRSRSYSWVKVYCHKVEIVLFSARGAVGLWESAIEFG